MEILSNHILFREAEVALKQGKRVKIRVVGKSMEPFLIDNKDVVRIIPFSSGKLYCGDIVLFKVNSFYCLHRIIKIKENRIILCGDAIYQSREYILRENILGILDSVILESGDVIACDSVKWKIKSCVWMALYPLRKYLLLIYQIFNKAKQDSSS